jgi:hypothetical protein
MGEAHEMYGRWDESGEFNPFDGEPEEPMRDERLDVANDIGLTCFNCGGLLAELRYPYIYCSELCAQEADLVRYARAVTADGRILRPDVAEAVGIRMGMVLAGGYPARERTLSATQRGAILERDGGRCRLCGAVATQIDHINDDAVLVARDINDAANLQAVCDECHRAKTLASFVPAGPEEQAKADELRCRIGADAPTRPSDDERRWKIQWRQHASERKALVKAATPASQS